MPCLGDGTRYKMRKKGGKGKEYMEWGFFIKFAIKI